MPRVSLDEKRAARAEVDPDPFVVVFAGEEFTLRKPPPFAFLEELGLFAERQASDDEHEKATSLAALGRSVQHVFGPGDWERFRALGPDEEDVLELVEAVTTWYTIGSLGESPRSAESSSATSEPSSPTSNGSTRSTSPEPVGATTQNASPSGGS